MADKIENPDNLVDAAGTILESEAKPGKLEQASEAWNRRRSKTLDAGFFACEVCGRPIKNFVAASKIVGAWVGPECVKKLRKLGYSWDDQSTPEEKVAKQASTKTAKPVEPSPRPAEATPAAPLDQEARVAEMIRNLHAEEKAKLSADRRAKRIAKASGPPGSKYARDIFKAHLDELNTHVEKFGVGGLDKLYDRARAELGRQAAKLGPKSSPIAAASVGVMKDQVHAVLQTLGGDLQKHLLDTSRGAAELGIQHASAEMGMLGEVFEAGSGQGPFPIVAVEGPAIAAGLTDADPSLLRRHSAKSGAYSSAVIGEAEQQIAVSHMIGKPLHETIDDVQKLIDDSRWKAERIVRTEGAYLHGAAKQATLTAVEKDSPTKLYKRIIETFDDRTGDDSFLIHGQTQEVGKPFSYKRRSKGGWKLILFAHPPNRPNDRATMIGWDPSWDETELERPLSLSELRAARTTRWRKTVGVKIPPGHVPGKPYAGKASKVEKAEAEDDDEGGED